MVITKEMVMHTLEQAYDRGGTDRDLVVRAAISAVSLMTFGRTAPDFALAIPLKRTDKEGTT